MHIPMIDPAMPEAQGLFDPAHGKDACGVGFIADLHNRKTHAIVQQGLQILLNLDHRGAVGADPKLGDGCGILVQIPHAFFVEECAKLGMTLPATQLYGVGQFFMPRNDAARAEAERIRALRREFADLHQEAWAKPGDADVRRRLAAMAAELDRPDLEQVWLEAAEAVEVLRKPAPNRE